MKIRVVGENSAAEELRKHLQSLGYSLGTLGASYTVSLQEHSEPAIHVYGGPGTFASEAAARVKELASASVNAEQKRNLSGNDIEVFFEAAHSVSVAIAVLRALLKATKHGEPAGPPKKSEGSLNWIQKFLGKA